MKKAIRGFGSLVKTSFRKIRLQDEQISPEKFIGSTILARRAMDADDEEVVVKDVVGIRAVTDPKLAKWFQINGTHMVHMLSYFTQNLEGRVPTDAELEEFELASDIVKMKEIGNGKEDRKS